MQGLKKNISEISITGHKSTQEQGNPSKKAKVDSSIDEKQHNLKKFHHHIKISKTMLVVLLIRHVNLMILQVILMVVQEIWMMNIKMKKMTDTFNLRLIKMIELNQKLVKG